MHFRCIILCQDIVALRLCRPESFTCVDHACTAVLLPSICPPQSFTFVDRAFHVLLPLSSDVTARARRFVASLFVSSSSFASRPRPSITLSFSIVVVRTSCLFVVVRASCSFVAHSPLCRRRHSRLVLVRRSLSPLTSSRALLVLIRRLLSYFPPSASRARVSSPLSSSPFSSLLTICRVDYHPSLSLPPLSVVPGVGVVIVGTNPLAACTLQWSY